MSVARPRDLFRVWPERATEVGRESVRQPSVLKIVVTEAEVLYSTFKQAGKQEYCF